MQVSKEELLHIANLACLEIEENELDNYLKNLEEILNFANSVYCLILIDSINVVHNKMRGIIF